jgi:hypothetical protein
MASTPSTGPPNVCAEMYGEKPFMSPCPPVAESGIVATSMRGPSTSPR